MSKKVVLAYSGGLDTSFSCIYLREELGYEVHAVAVNTGGFTPQDVEDMKARAKAFGVASFEVIDARQELYDTCLKYLIFGNVLRNQCYPLSVSAERFVQAKSIVRYANGVGAEAVAHGSTGAGNDQVRFDLVFSVLGNNLKVITPIRDLTISREEEVRYLNEHGFEWTATKAEYSINKGIWGTSVGGKETTGSKFPLPSEEYPSQLAKEKPQTIEITFDKGEPFALDGAVMDPVSLIEKLNSIGGQYAIGRDIHVGDTIMGIKGRVAFEAPAAKILLETHRLLEKHTLTRHQYALKQHLSETYGTLLHEAQFLDPVMHDIEAFFDKSQKHVSGKVGVKLLPYRFELQGIESKYDLMASKSGTYGEVNRAWTGEDSKGFIKILSNQVNIYHQLKKES
ncbi:MAG: argininosuccinate synthase [Bacteroidia bacterium]|nr:argininosuccinate synthase [Bacteroidia bacterium]